MEGASPPPLHHQQSAELNNHHTRQQPQRHRIYNRSASRRGIDAQFSLQAGQVVFRLLCHVNTAGGVIGNSGCIVKQLENETGSKIRFEEPLPNCHERVINVVGDSAVDRKILIKLDDSGAENEGFKVEVSRAQEGLMRVFERVLDVEGNENGVIGCRLLSGLGQTGAVLGKGGKIVDAIRRNSGAKIRVLKKDQMPACAAPEEELIQIMGDIIAVKKALLAVTHRLQDCTPGESIRLSSSGALQDADADADAEYIPNGNPVLLCFPGNTSEYNSVGSTLSADVDRTLSLDEVTNQRKVVFRLLCSNASAGGIIGKGANIVKALEKETGASIKFSSPVAGSKERVATISSLEGPDPQFSSAQIATVRVFARSIEVGFEQGIITGLGEGESITARILVTPNQIDCLIDDVGKVASDISAATCVEIELLGANIVPNCASENDKVVQIIGEYENVTSALVQVTGRLRDKLFSSMVPGREAHRDCSYSAIPDSSPHGKGMTASPQFDHLSNHSYANQVNHPGFVRKDMRKIKMPKDSARRLKASKGLERSVDADSMIPTTVEVFVPEKVFGCVYGENGSSLARLKEISGASIILQDPSPGKCDGKVIISGTPDRIQVAQSLLQAFILT